MPTSVDGGVDTEEPLMPSMTLLPKPLIFAEYPAGQVANVVPQTLYEVATQFAPD